MVRYDVFGKNSTEAIGDLHFFDPRLKIDRL